MAMIPPVDACASSSARFSVSLSAPTRRRHPAARLVSAVAKGTSALLALSASLPLGIPSAQAQGKALSKEERRKAQVVYVNLRDEPPSLDPTRYVDGVSHFWLGHMFEGLLTRGPKGTPVPGAAEGYTVSPDGKVYTFSIRANAKWHDGKPVTARDFEYTFKRLVDPAYASEYSFIAETAQLLNAADIIARKKPVSDLGVKALSDRRLEIRLHNPVVFFPNLMAFQTFYPVRKDLVEKHGDTFAIDPQSVVGNGPFKLAAWRKEAGLRIEKDPSYWNADSILIKAIEEPVRIKDFTASFNVFRTGGIDLNTLDSNTLKIASKEKLRPKFYLDGTVVYFNVNMHEGKTFSHRLLREALRVGYPRREYINKISGIPGDKPALGIVPGYMPGAGPGETYRGQVRLSYPDGDTKAARALVDRYLKETKRAKVPPITLLAGDTDAAKKNAEYHQDVLRRIFRTEVAIDATPFKAKLQKVRDGQFDLATSAWGPDYLDPLTFLELFTSGSSNNEGGFKSERYDALINAARTSNDPEARVKAFAEAERILVLDETGVVPYVQTAAAYLVSDGLTGIVRMQSGLDPDLRYASWRAVTASKR